MGGISEGGSNAVKRLGKLRGKLHPDLCWQNGSNSLYIDIVHQNLLNGAMVEAKLAEWLLTTLQYSGSNPAICIFYRILIDCQLQRKDRNRETGKGQF